MLVACAIAIIAYLVITGNLPQVFHDVVNEHTAQHGSNKSAEKVLFFIFSFIGIAVYTFYYFKSQRGISKINLTTSEAKKEGSESVYVLLGLLIFTAVYYFIYSGGGNWLLLSGMMLSTDLYVTEK